jgi:hypothetical protein
MDDSVKKIRKEYLGERSFLSIQIQELKRQIKINEERKESDKLSDQTLKALKTNLEKLLEARASLNADYRQGRVESLIAQAEKTVTEMTKENFFKIKLQKYKLSVKSLADINYKVKKKKKI